MRKSLASFTSDLGSGGAHFAGVPISLLHRYSRHSVLQIMADVDGVLKNSGFKRKDLNLKCQRNVRDRIADEIIGDWYRVGRTLDVSDAKLNCILYDNVSSLTSPADKAVAVLDAWAVEKGNEATCLKLAEALFSHSKVRTIEILCEEVKRDSTTSEPSTSTAVSHQTGDNQQQQGGKADECGCYCTLTD